MLQILLLPRNKSGAVTYRGNGAAAGDRNNTVEQASRKIFFQDILVFIVPFGLWIRFIITNAENVDKKQRRLLPLTVIL